MHYYELFTKTQYTAAMELNNFLMENNLGEVKLVTAFRYHGKLYSYSNQEGAFAGIIGSDNLKSILEEKSVIYECSFLLENDEKDNRLYAKKMFEFISDLSVKASSNIADLTINSFKPTNNILIGYDSVKVNSNDKLKISDLSDISFTIPIKTTPKSNLNCYFGKGRENKDGVVKPRHWYEVELIVPIAIRSSKGYPKGMPNEVVEFPVITDDGYEFLCQVNGGEDGLWNKNLRSSGDLTILGKWLKGRLENDGALKIGEPVTKDTLEVYGRNTVTMTKIKDSDKWYLDFGVNKES